MHRADIAVVEAVHRLDLILGNKAAYQEVFKPENISLRNKLRELCVKLMFLHPVDYGRKAEELLWRKVYYEVIQLIKTNKKAGICGSGMRKSLSTQGVRLSDKFFGWISCGLNTGQESRLSFILVMVLRAGNPHDPVRKLPLQRIF
ncbi:hypothetical protein AV530_000404 [Patagioenas fasciata monilis]|uniref:Uncharacterized protein n=1 Tax=Patagioenas fasciata monilis TaxID=372326 RepID=A0A1V4KDV3_PATFA|nr:hypothetical protein AV530_000404 [Patagioenas fasciata monilis]